MRPSALRLMGGIILGSSVILGGCDVFNQPAADSDEAATTQPKSAPRAPEFDVPVSDVEATPMAERVATLGLLNKRNGQTRDLEMKPGEQRRIGSVIVRLEACERTAPWEPQPETGAFVQVIVQERRSAREELKWRRVFSGWLFKQSPSLNVVEHPIYDVWVKDCAMRFPGDEAPVKQGASTPAAAAPAPASDANPATNAGTPSAAAPPAAPAAEGE